MIFAIYSCEDNPSSSGPPFEVTVTDTLGTPIEGAILEGGSDRSSFRVVTDGWGRAELPELARGMQATIKKNNYFSLIENNMRPGVYVLTPMPRILNEIGGIEGDLIRFEDSRILTLNLYGQYRVYSFDGYNLSEILMVELGSTLSDFKLLGDQLWYSTYHDGIYVYSLADPMNPAELIHLDIPGNLSIFDVKDSLVAAGINDDYGTIRLYSYHSDGSLNQLDTLTGVSVWKLYLRSHYLIATNYYSDLYTVFDVADPTDIRFECQGDREGYFWPFFYGDTLILEGLGIDWPERDFGYLMIDMTDPGNPSEIGGFMADGRFDYIVDDSTAVGRYCFDPDAMTVLKRNAGGDFEAVAMVSEYGHQYHHGSNPPYFLMADRLWRLEVR